MTCPNSVLITGAKSGLGLEFVRQFAKSESAPKYIFATGRNLEQAKELVELKNAHENIHFVEFDVTDDQQISNAVKTVSDILGEDGLNLLINNAGVCIGEGDIWPEIKRDVINRHINVNATSRLMTMQAFLPLLQKAANKNEDAPMSVSKAAVINVSDDSGCLDTKIEFDYNKFGFYGYAASMGALNILVKALGNDLKKKGILVVGICPGYVYTPMARSFLEFGQHQKSTAQQDDPQASDYSSPEIAAKKFMQTIKRLSEKHAGGYFSKTGEDFDAECC